jgi:hypothetical protein
MVAAPQKVHKHAVECAYVLLYQKTLKCKRYAGQPFARLLAIRGIAYPVESLGDFPVSA